MPQLLTRWLRDLELFTVDVIYGRRNDRAAFWWGGFLRSLSCVFAGLVKLRLLLYRKGVLNAAHLGCMVIVVGNLTVGGTGKTPVVEKLARSLRDRGRKVAILSRGYKSRKEPILKKAWRLLSHGEAEPPRVVSDGKQVLLDSHVAGDEPYMLAQNLPGVLVITDKDRVKAGLYAIRKFGVDTLILDDGFQYFRLKDHLQLLLIDKSNPFGNGRMLPRGLLREPISHMKRASYVVLTKSDGQPNPELLSTIQRYRPHADLIECTHQPQYLQQVNGKERLELSALSGKRVITLSAIAVPESFEDFVASYGARILARERYMDHHRFAGWELMELYAKARDLGADMLVTTEKDAVRIPPALQPEMPFYFLRVEIKILGGATDFEEAVSRICFPKKELRTTRLM